MRATGRLYLDAFGEPGRASKSLSIYTLCLVSTASSDEMLEAILARVRSVLGLRKDYEFHARKLTKQERREQLPLHFFQQLLAEGLEFQGWCAVMDKQQSRLPTHIAGKALTHELAGQAILRMSEEVVSGATLTFDGQQVGKKISKEAQELRSHINRTLSTGGRKYTIGRVIPKPAHRCAGVQLADFLAAAITDPWADCLSLFTDEQIHSWRT